VKKVNLALWLALAGLSLAGCGRAHLSSQYAQSYTAWFTAQRVNAKPANPDQTRRVMDGLDAQEAAAVSKNYRKARGAEDTAGGSRLLMIGAPRGGGSEASFMPAPSVPQ